MKGIEFLSKGTFVVLPTVSNPRVYLAIDNSKVAGRAFKLYQPFSFKTKVLKMIAKNLCIHANGVSKLLLNTVKSEEEEFVNILKKELDLNDCKTSVYFATDEDKVVVQLQNNDNVIGYLKYPLNNIGLKHIQTEKKAIQILSKLNIVDSYKYYGNYKKKPFLILKPIEGNINIQKLEDISKLLDSFKTKKQFRLHEHPRILKLQQDLKSSGLQLYNLKLRQVCETSTIYYKVVMEHGDFTPWNLIKTDKGLIPFDFEYFLEFGLEHLDQIKYYYQIERLLKGKTGMPLINSISKHIDLSEFRCLLIIFLIKELLNKKESDQNFEFERELLNIVSIEKT